MSARELEVQFKTRSFGGDIARPAIDLRVNSLEWSTAGGPKGGSITATGGSESALWELLEWLRRPVEICHPKTGVPVWWGYVHAAAVRVGAIEVGASLDSMVNRVAVAYSYVAPGTNVVGSRATTAWVQDDLSVATYGTKEFLSSCGGMTPEAAEARRDAILAAQRWPGAPPTQTSGAMTPRGRARYSGAKQSRSATLTLRGWWSTLGWKYVSVPTITAVSYETTSAAAQAVGAAENTQKVMQQVAILAQTVNAVTVQAHVRKIGSPTDSLKISIFSTIEEDDDANKIGLPDSSLGSALIAPQNIGATADWVTGTLSTEVAMEMGKTYTLVLERVGSLDASNYFQVTVNEALGYGGGLFRVYDGSGWVARSPDADMPFRVGVTNQVETTTQIADLVRQAGHFLTGTRIVDASGVSLASYLRGDTTADIEIDDLLSVGGPNSRRMLADVKRDRQVWLSEEPANSVVAALMDVNGELRTLMDQPVDEYMPPVGKWIRLQGVIPKTVDVSRLINPELQFVEGAAWNRTGGLRLSYRGQPSIDDILALRR
jgi:hypothetical protein